MRKYLLAVSVAVCGVSSAHAADIVPYESSASYDAPVVATPDFSWTGGYLGAQIGSTWAKTDVNSFYRDPADNDLIFRHTPDPSDFSGGLYLGYNFVVGSQSGFVVGVETDFSWGSLDAASPYQNHDMTLHGFIPGVDLVARSYVDQKWAGATRVHAAVALDRWLPYLAAGVAYAKVDSGMDGWLESGSVLIPGSAFSQGNSDTFTGWTVGVGSDYAVTDNLLLRLEYRYSDYGDKTYTYDLPGTGTDFVDYQVDHKAHDLRVGVAYKF